MTYSTGFTTEMQKSHGEALSTRVYIRRVDAENWYSETAGREWYYGAQPPTSTVYPIRYDGDYPVPVDANWRGLNTYEWGMIGYLMDEGSLGIADNICFSVYVNSDSFTYAHEIGGFVSLEIEEESLGFPNTRTLRGQFFKDVANPGQMIWNGWDNDDTPAEVTISYGIEYLGDNWSRIHIAMDGQFDGSPRDFTYSFNLHGANGITSNQNHTFYCGPQIETNSITPSAYVNGDRASLSPSELIELSTYDSTIGMNPITRKRERTYGVIQGQNTNITISDPTLKSTQYKLPSSVVAVQMGFASIDEWETVAQGSILTSNLSTDLNLNISIDESIMKTINSELPRNTFFGTEPWASEIRKIEVNTSSKDYSHDPISGGTIWIDPNYGDQIQDQNYIIEFVSPTEFMIKNESNRWMTDLTNLNSVATYEARTGTTFSITEDAEFTPANFTTSTNIFKITKDGWVGPFISGDMLEFTVSRSRTLNELTPVGVSKHIIQDIVGISVYDVVNGVYYDSPFENLDRWEELSTGHTGNQFLGGYWERGTSIVEMIQDALKIDHCSIYPSENGKVDVWGVDLEPFTDETFLNGDPSDVVNITQASMEDSDEDFANTIAISYLDLDPTNYEEEVNRNTQFVQAQFKDRPQSDMNISTGWRISDTLVGQCISRALVRFNETRRLIRVAALFSNADLDISNPIIITEPFFNLYSEKAQVVERAIDITNQSVRFVVWNDPLSLINKARIGQSSIDGTEQIW